MVDFIDAIFRETASRAAAGDVPLTYRQMRERWTDAIEKKNAFQLRTGGRNDGGRQDRSRQQTSRGSGSARGRGGGAPSKGGTAPQSRGQSIKDTTSATITTALPAVSGQ